MTFKITGLDGDMFAHLYGLTDDELAAQGAKRYHVDHKPGFPDRVEVKDMEPGETAILINYEHLPVDNPYRSRHAIFVREGATERYEQTGSVPEVMRIRMMSLRSFDENDMILDADLAEGDDIQVLIDRLFADPAARYIHAHYAKRGCFSARIDRA